MKTAAVYEQELRKCSDATVLKISTANARDIAFIERVEKVCTHIKTLTTQF